MGAKSPLCIQARTLPWGDVGLNPPLVMHEGCPLFWAIRGSPTKRRAPPGQPVRQSEVRGVQRPTALHN